MANYLTSFACNQCGGKDYFLEGGFYFCAECQLQSQDIQEQVFDTFYGGGQASAKAVVVGSQVQDVKPAEERRTKQALTSWEVLNYLMKGLVDELIALGAPRELKFIALQLWASYLMELQIAFISKRIEARPRLGFVFKRRDAELIYGMTDEESRTHRYLGKRKKRKRSERSSRGSDTTGSSLGSTTHSERYRLSLTKRELAKAEYKEIASESSQNSISGISLDSFNQSQTSFQKSSTRRSYKLKYSNYAKSTISNLLDTLKDADVEEKAILNNKLVYKEMKSLRNPTLVQVISIIKLSLCLLQANIHFSDIFRWADEGYLSISNAEKLLPKNVSADKDLKFLFSQSLRSQQPLARNVAKMARILKVDVIIPLNPLVNRFIEELQLPKELSIVVNHLIEMTSPKNSLNPFLNIEARAIALIIFSLKILFGLDDVTEQNLSKLAQSINSDDKLVKEKGEQFVWQEWSEYIVHRNALVSLVHQPTKHRHYRNSTVGGSDSFLSLWDSSNIQHTIKRKQEINCDLRDSMKRVLRFFLEPMQEPKIKPCTTPLVCAFETIVGADNKMESKSLAYLLDSDFNMKVAEQFRLTRTKRLSRRFLQCKPASFMTNVPTGNVNRITKKVHLTFVESDEELNRNSQDMIDLSSSDEEDKEDGGAVNEKLEKKVYCPGGDVWVYHIAYKPSLIAEEDFCDTVAGIFPSNFAWLLKECSKIVGLNLKDLYLEVMNVEKIYLFHLRSNPLRKDVRKYISDFW